MNDWGRWLHATALEVVAYIALALLFLLTLWGCGGGGSSSELPASAPIPRGALQTSFYGGCQPYPTFTTHLWAMGWCESRELTLASAKQAGKPVILSLPEAYQSPEAVRAYFTLLQGLGLLEQVAYLYPEDEPDLRRSEDEIVLASATAKAISSEFGIAPKLAVIYAGANDFPGLASFDLVGMDDYGKGVNVLRDFDALRSFLNPSQRMMLVPGGADPWRHDPAPFMAYAQAHGDVAMVTAFLWSPDFADRGVGLGIRSNGLAGAYCEAFTGRPC